MKKFKNVYVSKYLMRVYYSILLELVASLAAAFIEYEKLTIWMALVSAVFGITAFVISLNAVIKLRKVNGDFSFAFWWVIISFFLGGIGQILTAIGTDKAISVLVSIGSALDVLAGLTDVVLAMALIGGTKALLKENGYKKLFDKGTLIETIYVSTIILSNVLQGASTVVYSNDSISASQVYYLVIGIIVIVFSIIGYFGYLRFLRKSAHALS